MIGAHRLTIASMLAGVALLIASSPPASAQPDPSDWKIEYDKTRLPVVEAVEVRITNLWGNVTLRAGETDDIVISTTSQRHREDPRASKIDVKTIASGFTVEPRFDDSLEVQDAAEWKSRRIDLGVFLPPTLSVSIRTADSDVEVRGLKATADVETTSGGIKFRGGGELRARSDSGSIFAQFLRSDWARPSALETRIGNIRAELLEGAAVKAEIETRGPITSDFSTTIDRAVGSRLKRGAVTLGKGGQTLKLKSYSGGVRLVAVIVPEEQDAAE